MKTLLTVLVLVLFTWGAVPHISAQTPTPTPTPTFIQYDLAFPGMLPDNPFYKLKVLRDKISAVLTLNPLEKIRFFLRQTDKGILATAMLVDQGKIDLATQTALKAEHNFTLISQIVASQPENVDDATAQLLELAALKHQEVLASLANRVGGDKKETFLQVADFSKRNVANIKEQRQFAASDEGQNPNQ